mmetsp:Transcript_56823/g.139477  ORF Transcript_56823/g.139477 Transcript_56823/m.139477 type:complete len:221 (+) Transcript_56823:464-1126(+)
MGGQHCRRGHRLRLRAADLGVGHASVRDRVQQGQGGHLRPQPVPQPEVPPRGAGLRRHHPRRSQSGRSVPGDAGGAGRDGHVPPEHAAGHAHRGKGAVDEPRDVLRRALHGGSEGKGWGLPELDRQRCQASRPQGAREQAAHSPRSPCTRRACGDGLQVRQGLHTPLLQAHASHRPTRDDRQEGCVPDAALEVCARVPCGDGGHVRYGCRIEHLHQHRFS